VDNFLVIQTSTNQKPVEIMKAILPEDSQDEIPVGFSIVGHVGPYPSSHPSLPSSLHQAQIKAK
jgi:hypothetical protein